MKELAEDWLGEGRCVITGWKVNDGVNFWKNHYAKQKLKKTPGTKKPDNEPS